MKTRVFLAFMPLLLGVIAPSLAVADTLAIPGGWRPLEISELKDTADYQFRKPPDYSLNVFDDFDGDGRQDAARLLASADGKRYALFLTYHKNGKLVHKMHYSDNDFDQFTRMGVSLALPDTYETACGKGYTECGKDETPAITLKLPGIHFFMFEAYGSLIYWNKNKRKFIEILLSN